MRTLFFAFANQPNNILPSLQEEDDTLTRLLSPRAKEQHFLLHRDSFITLDKLPSYLTLYRDDLEVFLFSGHADRDRLLLHDGAAGGEGIARMLAQCPQLKLVFLNGCSTQGQVAALQAAGVPVIIATSAPVNDRKATQFSIRFFEALQQQFSIRDAFEMAKGAVLMQFKDVAPEQYRSAGFETENADLPAWGLYFTEKSEHVLDWKLPVQAAAVPSASDAFTPNKHLIDTLFAALAEYNDEIKKMLKQEKNGMQIPVPKKRITILNALPAPLSEPLRKLLVPVEQENEGFDKVSEARLRQITQAFNTSMDLLAYTMLAQLWESHDLLGKLDVSEPAQQELRDFFMLSRSDREVFDMMLLIRSIKQIFDQNNISYFVEELQDLRDMLQTDEQFAESFQFLNGLRLQARQNALDSSSLGYLSKRAEVALAYLYSKLGFLAKYKLATIQGIDVQKYRHLRTPRYNHATYVLHDLLGGFDQSAITLDKSMDNRSILLINEETWEYLNLSPFVIDENAFQVKTDVPKLYFFSHYLKAADICCYKYVYKPDDPYLEITDEKYNLVKDQLEAFSERILQQPLNAL